jgi:hypothetical protein
MNSLTIAFLVTALLSIPSTTHIVNTPIEVAVERPVVRQVKRIYVAPTPTPQQIELINKIADEYNVSAEVMTKVIACESGFNERALGDGGYSRGLVQIHKKYHPNVTDEMAYDPEFAITFLAEKLSQNDGHLWTCYRQLASR